MVNLEDLEKKINSELTTKIKDSKIKHGQIYMILNRLIKKNLLLKGKLILKN